MRRVSSVGVWVSAPALFLPRCFFVHSTSGFRFIFDRFYTRWLWKWIKFSFSSCLSSLWCPPAQSREKIQEEKTSHTTERDPMMAMALVVCNEHTHIPAHQRCVFLSSSLLSYAFTLRYFIEFHVQHPINVLSFPFFARWFSFCIDSFRFLLVLCIIYHDIVPHNMTLKTESVLSISPWGEFSWNTLLLLGNAAKIHHKCCKQFRFFCSAFVVGWHGWNRRWIQSECQRNYVLLKVSESMSVSLWCSNDFYHRRRKRFLPGWGVARGIPTNQEASRIQGTSGGRWENEALLVLQW